MVGADESIELWRPHSAFFVYLHSFHDLMINNEPIELHYG